MTFPIRIFVPKDAAARSVGADDVAARIMAEAEARSIEVSVVRTGTRGALFLEPLVEVETSAGRIGYGPVDPDDVTGLFDAGFPSADGHPLHLGPVDAIPYLARQTRVTFARCGVIDPASVADYRAQGGFRGLEAALAKPAADIVEDVVASGLRGRGGAGFPTGIKWRTVAAAEADEKYICCNADEGDSGTFADRILMEGDPFLLIEGMTIAGLAVGACTGYVYIRSEYPDAIAAMKTAIAACEADGTLGDDILGSGRSFRLHVRVGAGAYICGEESAMLDSLEGKRGIVRAKPPIPAIAGLFGKPTVVNNVLSFAAVPSILADGPEAYAAHGMGKSRGTMPFQIAGNIARGGLVELGFGVTLRELIEDFGGGTHSGRPVRAVQVGGPLGAYVPADRLDLPMDYEAFAEAGFMVGHGGIVVFDDTVDMARQARFAFAFCAIESCGKCTPCRVGAVRGRETMDRILAGEDVATNVALVEDLCTLMTDASLCAMGGLTPMPVKSALTYFPEDFDRAHAREAAE
ncbi:formate dehydrogenase beta subunit [Amorphus orientalis]|uniref:Formate dehydrogenase iron-sulfur subunit n=1 Tax=Amorphus orientalis TaxID=649198 RepID=A0AAE4AS93_9HYPH|nr:formate dehydrogenase beta subunit [Amorphus orientalis]MDQ0316001.1 formate dehydrogenase iron-sulfur subunit [Amorphus orientalis]